MAIKLFELVGSVFVDNESANESLSETDTQAQTVASSLASSVKSAASWAAGVASAAVKVGSAMVDAAKETADTCGEIDDAAQRMNIDAESYQKLAYAAELNGVEMSTMEKAAKSLVGTDMSFDEAMDSIMSLGTETERTQAAVELFGEKVAYDMQPLLQAGGESFYALQEEAVELGAVISNEAVSAGATMGDSFDKITAAVETLKTGLMAELMPVIQSILDWVVEHIPEIKATISECIESIQPIIQNLQPVIEGLFTIAGNLWETILKPALLAITTFLGGVFTGDWTAVFEGLGGIVEVVFNGLITIVKAPINGIIALINGFIDDINGMQIPDWVPGVGGGSLNISHIAYLASGGIVDQPTNAVIGEAGAEAVIPLSSSSAMEKLTNALGGGEMVEVLNEILDAVTGMTNEIYLDGDTLVGGIADRMNKKLGKIKALEGRGI